MDNLLAERDTGMKRLLYHLGWLETLNIPDPALARRAARLVLVDAARHIVGGYFTGSAEDRAVEMLLRIAEEIPL